MRWKVGNINYASGTIKIAGKDTELCVYDNGTVVCDAGHTITTPGSCVSQSVGTVNSSATCTSDYVDSSTSYAVVVNEAVGKEGTFKDIAFGGEEVDSQLRTKSSSVAYDEWIISKSLTISSAFDYLVWSSISAVDYAMYLDLDYKLGTFQILQRKSGYIPRGLDVTSQYFQLDAYGTIPILHPYLYSIKLLVDEKILVEDTRDGQWSEMLHTVVSGIEDVCVGDLTPPSIENASPAQYSHLNEVDGNLSFDVVDAIGGVNKSTVNITVSGNTTIQPEGYDIVTAGVPVAQASFDGTDSRYSLLYNPSNSWANNEIVTVTVTGADNVPDGPDGNPFSCLTGDPNPFGYEWTYQILDSSDFTASITAIADTGSPYLEDEDPTPFFGGIPADTDISFYIKDEYSGVDLSTVFVYINNVTVVNSGVVAGDNVSLTPVAGGYYFKYTNTSLFSYGSRVTVRVVADDLYAAAPNTLDYTYYFDIVGDGTLRIENFYPEVGVTWDPELVDIRVDVIDEVYDVDESDLYLSINGQQAPASISMLYGNMSLCTTFSGITAISGTTLDESDLTSATVQGTAIDGTTISGGSLDFGYLGGGTLSGLADPFCTSLSGTAVSGVVYEGVVVSGTVTTTLVSGVNWDGKYVSSTITGVDLTNLDAHSVSTSGTIISGTVGRRLEYHPPNDFDYQGAINVLVHGTNASCVAPVTVEQVYQLFHGYNVKVYDREFNHSSRVNVFVGALNTESFTNDLSYGYYFTTIDQPYDDMSASITGIAPWEELVADINPQAPVHRYGETMEVEVYVEDVEGNALGPYTFTYTIEEAPE